MNLEYCQCHREILRMIQFGTSAILLSPGWSQPIQFLFSVIAIVEMQFSETTIACRNTI